MYHPFPFNGVVSHTCPTHILSIDWRGLHYSTTVIRLIVPIYQSLQDVQILQGIRFGDITIKPIFQGTVESFCHAGFGISSGLKGVECLYLSQILKSAIGKFFAIIRLRFWGFLSFWRILQYKTPMMTNRTRFLPSYRAIDCASTRSVTHCLTFISTSCFG